jgi:hypothetical protein
MQVIVKRLLKGDERSGEVAVGNGVTNRKRSIVTPTGSTCIVGQAPPPPPNTTSRTPQLRSHNYPTKPSANAVPAIMRSEALGDHALPVTEFD